MTQATLNLHSGGEIVTREQLALIDPPPNTSTWFPTAHREVISTAENTLTSAGYEITNQTLSVTREGHEFFGVLDLSNRISEGVTLSVGVRNSTNRRFPLGFAVGTRVFVCSNLGFSSEIVISKRHTRYGKDRYEEGIAEAVSSLPRHIEAQGNWITRLQCREVSPEVCDSIILKSYEEELIGARMLPLVLQAWRNPTYEEFRPRNLWSLYNAFTTAIGLQKNPAKTALTTIKLQRLFDLRPNIAPHEPIDLYEPFPLNEDDYWGGD